MSLTKDEVVKMAREAGFIIGRSVTTGEPNSPERFATLCRAPLVAENAALKQEQTSAVPVVEQLVEAFDKAENSFMRKAIELEAEVAKLRGLVAGRSAEYLAAHITYDKGYQDGRLGAEAALKPVAEIGVSVFTWLGDRPPAGTTLYRIDQL